MVGYPKNHPKDSYCLCFPHSEKVKICHDVVWDNKMTVIDKPKQIVNEPSKQCYMDPTPKTTARPNPSGAVLIPMDDLDPEPPVLNNHLPPPNLPMVEPDDNDQNDVKPPEQYMKTLELYWFHLTMNHPDHHQTKSPATLMMTHPPSDR